MDVRAAPSRNRNLLYQAADGIPLKGSAQIVKAVKIAQVVLPLLNLISSRSSFCVVILYIVQNVKNAACTQTWNRDKGNQTSCGFCRQPHSGHRQSAKESRKAPAEKQCLSLYLINVAGLSSSNLYHCLKHFFLILL